MQRYAGYQQGAHMLGQAARMAYNYYGKRAAPRSETTTQRKFKKARQSTPKKTAAKVQQMSKTVNKLRSAACDTESTYKYRDSSSNALLSNINQQKVTTWGNPCYYTSLNTFLSAVPFFDPASPGTLSTTDMTSGTYGKAIHIASATSSIELRNNYQVPSHTTVYLCTIKTDTNLSAHGAWSASVMDESNLVGVEDLDQYPTDYSLVTNLWKLKRVFKGVINPGESQHFSHSVKDICYDPSDTQSQTDVYQRRYKSFQYLVITKGVIGHDTGLDQQGLLQSGLDLQGTNTLVLKYDANGAKIDRVKAVNDYINFTTGGVVSNKPISDNQAYSQV